MQTDTIFACHVEPNDYIVSGEFTYQVKGEPVDDGNFLLFDTIDDDGELTQLPFGPFDSVEVVTSFEEE